MLTSLGFCRSIVKYQKSPKPAWIVWKVALIHTPLSYFRHHSSLPNIFSFYPQFHGNRIATYQHYIKYQVFGPHISWKFSSIYKSRFSSALFRTKHSHSLTLFIYQYELWYENRKNARLIHIHLSDQNLWFKHFFVGIRQMQWNVYPSASYGVSGEGREVEAKGFFL